MSRRPFTVHQPALLVCLLAYWSETLASVLGSHNHQSLSFLISHILCPSLFPGKLFADFDASTWDSSPTRYNGTENALVRRCCMNEVALTGEQWCTPSGGHRTLRRFAELVQWISL